MVTGPAVGEEDMNGNPARAVVKIVVVAAKGRNLPAGGEPPASPLPGPGRRLPSTSRSDPFEVDGFECHEECYRAWDVGRSHHFWSSRPLES